MHFPLFSTIVQPDHCDPLYLLRTLGSGRQYSALLESADRQGNNDYSFVALGARDTLTIQNGKVRGSRFFPDGPVEDVLSPFETLIDPSASGERLQMGYIGFVSFEAARQFESIDLVPDPDLPDAEFFLPEILLKIDHRKHEVTIIAHEDTAEDIAALQRTINASPFREDENIVAQDLPEMSPQEIDSYRQTSKEDFCTNVRALQEEILAGEVFQVVLSQELKIRADVPSDQVYEALRALNPSPYMYYFKTPERTIVGASPETLIRVEGKDMLYRPIAGTRKRTGIAEKDALMRDELLHDEKERCEHQMLVDLGRSDIGRIAEIGTVAVRNSFRIEQYAHVFHLVTDVIGRLPSDKNALDALRTVFPAGTLTGAPKIRAMELIRRHEKSPRGIYGGAFGYIDLGGNLDMAITIRTMLFQNGDISLRVGAGIVKDSIPEHEDDECLHKAKSCLAAIHRATFSPRPS